MSDKGRHFSAQEAFAYVDTYRSGILKTAEILREEKERLDRRYWESPNPDPLMVVELRALEHAINRVEKGEEPGLVNLGDVSPQSTATGGDIRAELSECQENLAQLTSQRSQLEEKLKQARNQGQEMQAEVIRARQQSQILMRRLSQSNSTFVVVVATMFLVILVQLYLLWKH